MRGRFGPWRGLHRGERLTAHAEAQEASRQLVYLAMCSCLAQPISRGLRRFAGAVLLLWWAAVVGTPQGPATLRALPSLVAHYHEHRATDGALSLGAFLVLHYANAEHAQAEDHSALPLWQATGPLQAAPAAGLALTQPPPPNARAAYWVAERIGWPRPGPSGVFRPPIA